MPKCSAQTRLAEYCVCSQDRIQVAFVDLKSAFDVANGKILLDKIYEFGIKAFL